MSWQIRQEESGSLFVLDGEMRIQDAVSIYEAALPLAFSASAVRVSALVTGPVHTSIMQILYTLSQSVSDFGVTEASEDFAKAEVGVGLFFARAKVRGAPASPEPTLT